MEPKPGQIKSIDHAEAAAYAAKPLVDIARENWVNKEQKEALYAIAESRGNVVLQNIRQNEATEPKKEPEKTQPKVSEKSLEKNFLFKTLELIKHNPNINFIAYGTGNITGKAG